MIIDSNIREYAQNRLKHKVVAMTLSCVMTVGMAVPISAAEVENQVSEGISASEKLKSFLCDKWKELTLCGTNVLALFGWGHSLRSTSKKISEAVAAKDRAIADKNTEIEHKNQQITEKDRAIAAKEEKIEEKTKQLITTEGKLKTKDSECTNLQRETAFWSLLDTSTFELYSSYFQHKVTKVTHQRTQGFTTTSFSSPLSDTIEALKPSLWLSKLETRILQNLFMFCFDSKNNMLTDSIDRDLLNLACASDASEWESEYVKKVTTVYEVYKYNFDKIGAFSGSSGIVLAFKNANPQIGDYAKKFCSEYVQQASMKNLMKVLSNG